VVPSNDACRPLPAVAAVLPVGRGRLGQTVVQPEATVQGTFFWAGEVSRYTVRPRPSTTTCPKPDTLPRLNRVPGDAEDEPAVVLGDGALVLLFEELLHAAEATTTAVAQAPRAKYVRRR
jgi:hypothetical protein